MRVIVRIPPGQRSAGASGAARSRPHSPGLLVSWSQPGQEFLDNLLAVLDPRRPAARYWGDIFPVLFLPPWRPRRSLAASLLTHAAVAVMVWNLTPFARLLLPAGGRQEERRTPLRITWYHFADELPAISPAVQGGGPNRSEHGGSRRGPSPRGATAFHPQQVIISHPPQPDNAQQTIYQPETPNIRITRDVRLPNIVLWQDVEKPLPPVDLVKREVAKLTLPASLISKHVDLPQEMPNLERRISDLKITASNTVYSNPKLPVPPATPARAPANAELPPPPPPAELPGGGGQENSQLRRLIAVGVNPAPPGGPLEVPPGNREGSFSVAPAGKTPGTPAGTLGGLQGAGVVGPAPAGEGSGEGPGVGAGNGNGVRDMAAIRVPGLSVSGGAGAPVRGPVVAGPPEPPAPRPALPSPLRSAPQAGARAALLARATRPQLPGWGPSDRRAEQGFLPGKKVYTVYINMPNLTSASGSWILRFADLEDRTPGDDTELTAPVALRKVDPGYVPDAVRERVEGLVVLRAIIRKDGRVARVEVLRSLDPRLDERAVAALGRWEFQPATRNGVPVDLEAVVQIPFALPHAF